jgi:hypothetical protein
MLSEEVIEVVKGYRPTAKAFVEKATGENTFTRWQGNDHELTAWPLSSDQGFFDAKERNAFIQVLAPQETFSDAHRLFR